MVGDFCVKVEGDGLQHLHNLRRSLALRVACRGNTLFRGIADGEDGDEVVVCHLRECFLQLRCIKMSDPRRAQPFVVNGEHDVGRDDGGIHIGEIASVVLTYPCLVRLSADDEEDACTEGV